MVSFDRKFDFLFLRLVRIELRIRLVGVECNGVCNSWKNVLVFLGLFRRSARSARRPVRAYRERSRDHGRIRIAVIRCGVQRLRIIESHAERGRADHRRFREPAAGEASLAGGLKKIAGPQGYIGGRPDLHGRNQRFKTRSMRPITARSVTRKF